MGRGYALQQQQSSYAMHMESRQQQSYSMHKETCYSNNSNHQNHVTPMHVVPAVCVDSQALRHHAKFGDGGFAMGARDAHAAWHGQSAAVGTWSHSFGAGKTLMPIAVSGFDGLGSSQFSNFSSAAMFGNNGNAAAIGNAEFETFQEVFGPATRTVRMQEVRYERRSWGGCGGGF